MIISFNTGKVETKGGTGLLQQKRVEITNNGLDVVVPDAGYDGLSTVYVKTDVAEGGGSSFKDFTAIGYNEEENLLINQEIDNSILYSKELYDAWNPENTSANNLYNSDTKLVYAPAIDTSNVTNMFGMYKRCTNLKVVPKLNTDKVTKMGDMFSGCTFLTKLDLSNWNTSKVTDMSNMFASCQNLIEIGNLDTSSATTIHRMFFDCKSLITVPKISLKSMVSTSFSSITSKGAYFLNGATSVTTFGGFVDCEHITVWGGADTTNPFSSLTNLTNIQEMGVIKSGFNLSKCTKLTVESLMVVINALYDYATEGSTTQTIILGSTNLNKLSDAQIAVGTSKGWTLS